MNLEQKLIEIMKSNDELLEDLKLVQGLNLPDWWIAAGYVRNYCWDILHGHEEKTPLNDVDVIYYDAAYVNYNLETAGEKRLKEQKSKYNWSIKNQARMHITNHTKPYLDISDAMKHWPETATAVGISMNEDNQIEIIAPHGLADLFGLKIRKSPYFEDIEYYHERVKSKQWTNTWHSLIKLD